MEISDWASKRFGISPEKFQKCLDAEQADDSKTRKIKTMSDVYAKFNDSLNFMLWFVNYAYSLFPDEFEEFSKYTPSNEVAIISYLHLDKKGKETALNAYNSFISSTGGETLYIRALKKISKQYFEFLLWLKKHSDYNFAEFAEKIWPNPPGYIAEADYYHPERKFNVCDHFVRKYKSELSVDEIKDIYISHSANGACCAPGKKGFVGIFNASETDSLVGTYYCVNCRIHLEINRNPETREHTEEYTRRTNLIYFINSLDPTNKSKLYNEFMRDKKWI